MEKVNKVQADTLISDAVTKIGKLEENIGNTVASFCATRAIDDKLGNVKSDVKSMIKDLPADLQVGVLLQPVQVLANQLSNHTGSRKDNYEDFHSPKQSKSSRPISVSDIFGGGNNW